MSLRQQFIHNIKWTGLSSGLTILLQFVQFFVLARLLSKTDFGLMSLVMVASGFAQVFCDMGTGNAIIHKQDIQQEHLSSLYWFNIVTGLMILGLLCASSPLIAYFFHEPRLVGLICLVSLNFLIIPWGQQFNFLFQKHLNFAYLSRVEVCAAFVGTSSAIALALSGGGVVSLIVGQLANSIVRTGLLVYRGYREWKPLRHFRFQDLTSYLSFGLFQLGERTLNYFSANVDYMVVGHFLGAAVLGTYAFAYQLVTMPLIKFNPILTRVAFPIFAKKQRDNPSMATGYLEICKALVIIIFPVLLLLAISAPKVLPLFFGARWNQAIPLIRALVLMGMLKTLGNPVGSIFLAKGKVDYSFYWNIGEVSINALVFLAVVHSGALAVAIAQAALNVLYFFAILLLLRYLIGLRLRDYFRHLQLPLVTNLVAGVLAFFCLWHAPFDSLPLSITSLIFTGCLFLAAILSFNYSYVKSMVVLLLGARA